MIRRKAQDPQLAADLLNDAVLTTLEHVNSGRVTDPSHIGGYVFQVALNLLKNHRRKFAERSDRRVEANEATLAEASPSDAIENDWADRVRKMLEELPTARDRILLKRFYLDEDDKDDICRDLNLSPIHFDKIMFRARQRIRALFEARGLKKIDFISSLLLAAVP